MGDLDRRAFLFMAGAFLLEAVGPSRGSTEGKESSQQRPVTSGALSPTGWITFHIQEGKLYGIDRMRADGTARQPLIRGHVKIGNPSVAPEVWR